jgi:hypothetical protein
MRTVHFPRLFLLALACCFSINALSESAVRMGMGGSSSATPTSAPEEGNAPLEAPPPTTARMKSVASGLYMTGQFTYLFSGGTVNVTLSGINNDSFTRTTGTLRVELWATTSFPPRGNTNWVGYRLATSSLLTPLAPRTFYSNLSETVSYRAPPTGSYWLILILEEYDPVNCSGDGYCSQDTFISFHQESFGVVLPTFNYSDLWWNSSESGWGLAILHHATNIAFVAWYTYDSVGNPKWYVASNCPFVGDACTGALYETSGPPLGTFFNPAFVTVRNVGSVTLSFSSQNTGTMTYNVRGIAATKFISRQPF